MLHHLQERGGSSLPAIKKYVAEHHSSLPGPWEKTLSYQIKKMTASGKLVKVKYPFPVTVVILDSILVGRGASRQRWSRGRPLSGSQRGPKAVWKDLGGLLERLQASSRGHPA